MEAKTLMSATLSKRGQRRTRRSLFEAFLDACKSQGAAKKILTDGDGRVFSYGDLRKAALALSAPLNNKTKDNANVGYFLPIAAGAALPV